jgi:Cu/Ag efflux protein CusF
MEKLMKINAAFLGVCLTLLWAADAQAQRTKSSGIAPCCNITAISMPNATVTARDKAGTSFQFTVRDAALLKRLRVGQSVSVNYQTRQVSVDGAQPCCALVNVDPIQPCCSVMAVDSATGIATARELATGRVFRFEVKDRALLLSLKPDQKVFADFGSSKVRIHGAEPCCNIIGHGVN